MKVQWNMILCQQYLCSWLFLFKCCIHFFNFFIKISQYRVCLKSFFDVTLYMRVVYLQQLKRAYVCIRLVFLLLPSLIGLLIVPPRPEVFRMLRNYARTVIRSYHIWSILYERSLFVTDIETWLTQRFPEKKKFHRKNSARSEDCTKFEASQRWTSSRIDSPKTLWRSGVNKQLND